MSEVTTVNLAAEDVAAADHVRRDLANVLRDGLRKVGIDAEVDTEAVPDTLLHRAIALSSQWERLSYGDRQEVVWRILDTAFSRDEQLHISSVTTLTPDELEGR
jgi:4'-phosphopantetheinyl transferase EntD